ncbi:MAG: redox-sensing transcriptional repressor Rex, partial [Firmicutes bacterium]|nr:redox-sensing transcriptional repressor Rex [Bacillota bacterium]
MERFSNISMAVVRRLPKYYRHLGEIKKKDIKRVSS